MNIYIYMYMCLWNVFIYNIRMYINTIVHVYLHSHLNFWRVSVSQDALTAIATIFGSVGVPSVDSRPQDDYTTLQAQHENEWSNGPFSHVEWLRRVDFHSEARQTAVMARAKQACEDMHIDWCETYPNNSVAFDFGSSCYWELHLGSSILMMMSSCIHHSTGKLESPWQNF